MQRCAAEVSRAVPKSLQEALAAGEDTREARRRLTKVEEKKILAPLLRLRQACCHPQVRPCLSVCQLLAPAALQVQLRGRGRGRGNARGRL